MNCSRHLVADRLGVGPGRDEGEFIAADAREDAFARRDELEAGGAAAQKLVADRWP